MKLIKSGVELKNLDEAGRGLARIATLSGIDHDGDTYAAGAFSWKAGGEQTVQILPAHNRGSVPLGKARLYEKGDEVLAELSFNLDTAAGKEWHAALKFDLDAQKSGGAPIQEWSYGFMVIDAQVETRDGERVRVLKKLDVHEVSPVVKGAGVGTGTLSLKDAIKDGRPFGEALDAAIAATADLVERARAVKDMRSADGRQLSAERVKQLAELRDGLAAIVDAAEAEQAQARQLYAGFVARSLGRR